MARMNRFDDATIIAHGVRLRPFDEADIPLIAGACSHPSTQRWIPLPNPYTTETAREFAFTIAPQNLSTGFGLDRAIEVDGEFAGVIGLGRTRWPARTTEAGYWLGPWARGRGIAARALTALTDWVLDTHDIGRVEVIVATGNAASLATARKAGFIHEGTMRRAQYLDDGPTDLALFSRLFDDPRPS